MAEEENIIEKFKSKEFGFNGRGSIARCIIGDNVFIVKDNDDGTYNFIKISKSDYDNFYKNEKEKKNNDVSNAIIDYIEFNQTFFNNNKDKFIKSLNDQQLTFDNVKKMSIEDFKKLKVSGSQLSNINTFTPELIPESIPEEKVRMVDDEELMGDDDEEEESKMIDEDEEEEKRLKDIEEKKRKMKEEEEEKPDAFEDDQVFLEDEYDKEKEYSDEERELFKQAKKMKDKKFQPEQEIQQKKQRSGKMGKEDMDVFDQLTRELNFTQQNENTGKSYLKVGDDIIFIRKPKEGKKGVSQLGNNNYLAVKLNKEDVQRIYTKKDLDKVEAEYFNFSTDYFDKNKGKIIDSIKKGKFVLDDELKKNKEDSRLPEKFKFEDLKTYDIMPRYFDYVNVLGLRNGNISEKRKDNGQQIIQAQNDQLLAGHTPNGEELRALIKYNNNSDSLLKLIVSLSENNKGEVDFKEIGEIQDLNGDITNLYSDMQELKSKINSSNNAEEKERLLIKYNKKRLKLEDLIKKYSKEAYRLSTLNKKKKATYSNPNYIKNKLSKL